MILDDVLAVLRNLVPVDYVPPVRDILGPTVLVLEVVRVLPHVDAEERQLPRLHHRNFC